MRFRVKDLGIDVQAEAAVQQGAVQGAQAICGPSSFVCTAICSFHPPTIVGCQLQCSTHPTVICTAICSLQPTPVGCQLQCSFDPSIVACGPLSPLPCGASMGPAVDPMEGLTALRGQLEQALAQVQQQEKAAAEAMAPQTVEQVDLLQGKLQEALDALKERRSELEQQA